MARELCLDRDYLKALGDVFDRGEWRDDRTGTGSWSLFGGQMRFDIRERFPLLTSKQTFWRGVVEELLWFLRGETNIKSLQDRGVSIWDEWADGRGEVGPIYGSQWRKWVVDHGSFSADQILSVIDDIKENPSSRRHVVSAWNVDDLHRMALPPCHMIFQFYVGNDGTLSCHMNQRSCDMFLGVPFNIASYALLTYMIAHVTGLKPGELVISMGDYHIYDNHRTQTLELLERGWQQRIAPSPKLEIVGDPQDISSFSFDNFVLHGYSPLPAIKAPISV